MTGVARHRVRIEPVRRWEALELWEVWAHRDLLRYLVWRDLKVRYKQTALGVMWAVVQPLAMVLIFTVVFGRLAQLPSEGVPYAVFTLSALLPWQLFSTAFTSAGNSIVGNAGLVTKVYFPRLIVPLAAVGTALVDFSVWLVLLAAMLVWYRVVPGPGVFALPFFCLLAVIAALGAGLWTAALNVRYRDVRYALPFLLQILLFASPVAYSMELVPEGLWRTVYGLNPLAGIIQGFRWALVGASPPGLLIVPATAAAVLLLVSGLYYFRHSEDTFADLI